MSPPGVGSGGTPPSGVQSAVAVGSWDRQLPAPVSSVSAPSTAASAGAAPRVSASAAHADAVRMRLRGEPMGSTLTRSLAFPQDLRPVRVDVVTAGDLAELLPLMRSYCDFYEAAPPDDALMALCQALLDAPGVEGVQLLARDEAGRAVGFATIFWSWSTLRAARIGVMNDLFVDPSARGGGYAEALIRACAG